MVDFLFLKNKIFNYLKGDQTYLERDPLQIISKRRIACL